MGTSLEPRAALAGDHRAPAFRGPIVLRSGAFRLSLEPDGSVRFMESLAEQRLIFGREQLSFFRVQAGAAPQLQKQDWKASVAPGEASFSAKLSDSVDVSQSVRLLPRSSVGYTRRLTLRNAGQSVAKLRVIDLHDPTTAHFRDRSYGWGSIGVNAFNRSSHVAMDEVAEPPAARVVGAQPAPKILYMTVDRAKAQELTQSGELPESTAGMSGQVLVLAQHEFELAPGASVETTYVSLYNPSKLEDALSDFGALFASRGKEDVPEAFVSCSSVPVASGLIWARAALEGVEYEADLLDRLEALRGLAHIDPAGAKAVIESAKAAQRGDGSMRHSADPLRAGVLETAVFLDGASRFSIITADKKYMRATYQSLRRAANFLLACSAEGRVALDGSLPQGWRRRIGRGYPTGELPEVSLAVAGALAHVSSLSSLLGKAEDSAKYKERSLVISAGVRKRMLDERGWLGLNLDGAGTLHAEETVDQAVACYRHHLDKAVAASLVHRLMEKDFETGYGPRTVPTSNRICFSGSYGQGQLGGYWTRAALAHTILAYQSGLGGTGSLELEAVGRLVTSEVARLGGTPGDFPYWVDVERKDAQGRGNDPVAASRYVETVVSGELGLASEPGGYALRPSPSSSIKWILTGNLWVGKGAAVFVGRAGGKAHAFVGGAEIDVEGGGKYSGFEAARSDNPRFSSMSFHGPGQLVCVGNTSDSTAKSKVAFKPRDPALSRHLTAGLEELDPASGSWRKVSQLRVLSQMTFDVVLGPGEWKAFRISTG